MSTSIDRKLARCAREIDEAKPKGLSLDEFRFGSHELRMTASKAIKSMNDFWANLASAKPLSAPPPIAEALASCDDAANGSALIGYGGFDGVHLTPEVSDRLAKEAAHTLRGLLSGEFSTEVQKNPTPPIAETKAFKVEDLCRIIAGGGTGWVATVAEAFSSGGFDMVMEGRQIGLYDSWELELIPESPPKTEANGWVAWAGVGEPDLGKATSLTIRFRDGGHLDTSLLGLGANNWAHVWGAGDIVAYKVLS